MIEKQLERKVPIVSKKCQKCRDPGDFVKKILLKRKFACFSKSYYNSEKA